METINLRLALQQGRIFHELAEGFAGRGGLLLRSGGLDPTRPSRCRQSSSVLISVRLIR